VFLVARPSVDLEGMRAYLDEVGGGSWLQHREQEEGIPGAELLAEFAGRICYRSWEPGLNPNVTRVRTDRQAYFANVMQSFHGSVLEHASFSFAFREVSRVFCYDAETEVLTDGGWKSWEHVDGSETFATVNPDDGSLEYQRATEHFASHYDGPMYRLQSEQVDLLVTPNHRMWVKALDAQADRRGEETYGVRHAHELMGRSFACCKTVKWSGQDDGWIEIPGTARVWTRADPGTEATRHYLGSRLPLREFARFLGHWLAESSLSEHQISIAPDRGESSDAMARNIGSVGLAAGEPVTDPGVPGTQNAALRDHLATCGREADGKQIPDYVHQWGPSVLREFLEAVLDGAGSRHEDGGQGEIYTPSQSTADDLQVLAIKAGWSANIRVDDRTGLEKLLPSGQRFKHRRPCYIVSLIKSRTHPLVNHGGRRHDSWQAYSGKIYCVKVPNGLLIVRRNGKPVVSGNTHELVRHRAGSAFSQESLRYVRLTDVGFRVPEALEPIREQVITLVEQLEEFQVSAADALGLDEEGVPFAVKKEITSALRRLAPIGLSTDILWTANVRTLRHVIEMRTAAGAEEELRLVFDRVAEIVKVEAPLLFQDFCRQDDGSWCPEWRKV
jgi:thymidylate synthase ThyX